MGSLVAVVVLVLPGFAAYYIARNIGPAEHRPLSDYEKTLVGLAYNLPGLALAWGFLAVLHHSVVSFSTFQGDVMEMPYFVYYGISVVTCAVLVAFVWDKCLRDPLNKVLNHYRKQKKRPHGSDKTPWEVFFGTEQDALFRMYPIGERDKFIFGEAQYTFVPGDSDKGIHMTATGQLEAWDGWFGPPLRTYVDTQSKMVYEMYPESAWEEAQLRAREYEASLSSWVAAVVESE